MNILIADPDAAARRALREALAPAPDTRVIAECGDGREIMPVCTDRPVDLLFLDMNLPRIAEFWQAFAAFDAGPTYLVGLAADETAALQALEHSAMDFILKPVTPGAVKRCFVRLHYLSALNHREPPPQHAARLPAIEFSRMLHSAVEHVFGRQRSHHGKLAVKVGTHVRLLKLMHIMYARAAGDYIDITLSTGERIHTKGQLANLMSSLPVPQFVRTHRSFVLNREYVKEIRAKNHDYELVLTDNTVIASGSTFRKEVRQQFLLNTVQ